MYSKPMNHDVAVIGAGPQGLLFAIWLKRERPSLNIVILDRAESPGHKIGESTLSGFCRAMRSTGIRHEVLQRLFYTKNGLGFFYSDTNTSDLQTAPEYITETFDETFQVERRTCDSLLVANANRVGVSVLWHHRVKPNESVFSAGANRLECETPRGRVAINARFVVDASGPSSVLGRHFSRYCESNVPFQTSAAWAYFKNVKWLNQYQGWRNTAEFPRDEYTQHICFKEGWVWYIPIISWQKATDDNLMEMLNYLATPDSPMLTRDELSQKFNCPYEQIWSIGIVLRSDRDQVLAQGPQAAFEHYKRKIPALTTLLDGAEILKDHYPNHNPYAVRKNFRRFAQQITGDGWLLIGDAAFFIDPLRSPGLTGGVATAYYAVQEILGALDEGNLSRSRFDRYEAYVQDLFDMLEEQNQIAYMSHNHPQAISLVRRFGEVSSRGHFNGICDEPYQMADTNVWGHLCPKHRQRQRIVWKIMREEEVEVGARSPIEEQEPKDYERMMFRLRQAVGGHLDLHMSLTPYIMHNKREQIQLSPTKAIAKPYWVHPAQRKHNVRSANLIADRI
ncbi:MAG: NAD(P)/FAD-dependent oxidoreductase [Pseudanabaenales cyanobacterium]|nr:NAD(P)/FAD-dependent oxidoreductase [Pseudanabaenales cyanobacterium]